MPQVRIAAISNDDLSALIQHARLSALSAESFVSRADQATKFADAQNKWADIYQELLDRRLASAR